MHGKTARVLVFQKLKSFLINISCFRTKFSTSTRKSIYFPEKPKTISIFSQFTLLKIPFQVSSSRVGIYMPIFFSCLKEHVEMQGMIDSVFYLSLIFIIYTNISIKSFQFFVSPDLRYHFLF